MAEFLRILRRRWRAVTILVLLGVAAASVVTAQMTPTYRSTAQLFVAFAGTSANDTAESLSQGSEFAANRVTSYPELVTSPRVLDPVIEDLGLSTTPRELGERVSASVATDTVLIEVEADAPTADESAQIANAVSRNLIRVVQELDRVNDQGESPVRVSFTRAATPPESPSSPVPAINIPLGLVLGLALGIGLALLRESLDNTIKTDTDVETTTGLRALASVPANRRVGKTPVLQQDAANPVWAESYRKLRTNISYLSPDDPPRSLMVTSSHEGDGKTLTAVNLAATLAQGGRRTVLVDADLRRPSVHRLLDLVPDVGVSSAITSKASIEALIQQAHGFDVITSGVIPPNPSEMLDSNAFRSMITKLRAEYDHVVIDTPPLLAVTDAALVATTSDTVILVCRSGETKIPDLKRALRSLRAVDAHVAGIVLNRVSSSSSSYGYAYESREAGRRWPRSSAADPST